MELVAINMEHGRYVVRRLMYQVEVVWGSFH
jgi:hypothetical protein